jgi:choline-sulfatase
MIRSGICAIAFLCGAASAQTPVILISVDTLRADHLGVYGYHRARTPNIDALAEGGMVIEQASAQVPLTLPSHFSLFTSTYPFSNRVEENAVKVPTAVTLASVLRAHGYATAAFIGAIYLERELGMDQGFDFYDSPFRFEAFSSISGSMFYGDRNTNPLQARSRRDGALVIRVAEQWLHANRDKPAFAFVHLFDLHQPYHVPPSAERRAGISDYDADLEYVDHLIGSFHQALARDGLWDRSLVVFVSDHGESLGDHGEQTHGYFIYQSTLHVPLIFHWPAGSSARVASTSHPAGLIDVAPTILDFLKIPAPPSFAGRSLLRDSANAAVYSESLYSHDAFGWSPLRSLRSGPYKYIAAPQPELYNLADDPKERTNLIAKQPDEARSLQSDLAKLMAARAPEPSGAAAAVSPEKMAALKSLGYLAPGSRAPIDTGGADPKRRLAEYALYEKAEDEILSGRNAGAISILRQILADDPKNTLARRDLGIAYNALAQYANARTNLQQVVAAAPDDFMAHFVLGLADEHLDLLKDAAEQLRIACRIAPESGGCQRELKTVEQKLAPE